MRSFVYYTIASGFSPVIEGHYMHAKLTQVDITGSRRALLRCVVSSGNLAVTNSLGSSNATEVYEDRPLFDGLLLLLRDHC